MAFYYDFDGPAPQDAWMSEGLLRLRKRLDREIPRRTLFGTLLLATWNIREFDSPSFGYRSPEAYHYIAEIVSRFDLVALQEVRDDLAALEKLAGMLGPWWRYLVSDVTAGRQGNKERLAYLYDSRKVRFGGVVGEVVIPPIKVGSRLYEPQKQLARTPYLAGFQCGWFRFMLCTAHILYGDSQGDDPRRLEEIRQLAGFLAGEAAKDHWWAKNLVLLGDFNIFDPGRKTLAAIEEAGFLIPEKLKNAPSNAKGNRHFDRIAVMFGRNTPAAMGPAGVFNYFLDVYRNDQEAHYAPEMGPAYHQNSRGAARSLRGQSNYYRTYWRTHQMSDHLPMWAEFGVDFGDAYLERKVVAAGG